MKPLFDSIANFLAAVPWLWIALWLGIAGLVVALLVLMLTRWGQSDPMRKCIVLALLAHLLLAGYSTTVQIVASSGSPRSQEPIMMLLSELPPEDAALQEAATKQVDPPPQDTEVPEAADSPTEDGGAWSVDPAEPRPRAVEESATQPRVSSASHVSRKPTASPSPNLPKLAVEPQPLDLTSPQHVDPAPAIASPVAPNRPLSRATKPRADVENATVSRPLASAYKSREPRQRRALLEEHGGNDDTEAAVAAARVWLAAAQERDGHWSARRWGSGQEQKIDGQDRSGSGAKADTGVTGLAILAMLGAGHTHKQGPYAQNVKAGLEFLMRTQAADGNLYGDADAFARMYSHAMATFALSEAYAMTRDGNLRPTVERAVAFSIKAQNTTTGGWRYLPGDTGDTSQHGWQLMSLRSARLAGIEVPDAVFDRAARFLTSVASGRAGGLASYRPGQLPTRSMTAEALVSRQLLGVESSHDANAEAGQYLLQTLPGEMLPGEPVPNLYYCYYGTLGMFQLQDVYWRQWNPALKPALMKLQNKDGSWPTATRWGGYGGQVYTTAMGAMCLEVYYRYLPFYREAKAPVRPMR